MVSVKRYSVIPHTIDSARCLRHLPLHKQRRRAAKVAGRENPPSVACAKTLYRSLARKSGTFVKTFVRRNSMEEEYLYRPLSNDTNIRLLVLQPAKNLTDKLVGTLEEVGLETIPYTALSYSWAMEDDRWPEKGDSSATKLIVLDGAKFLMGENLRDALRRLREKSTSLSWVWVDALCINQRDNAEKSAQVAMMGSIYGKATKVVAWLGEGNEKNNEAAFIVLQCMFAEQEQQGRHGHRDLRMSFASSGLWHSWISQSQYMDTSVPRTNCGFCYEIDEHGTAGSRLSHHSSWSMVEILSRRRYFSRLWVVQEVSIPRVDQVEFQWGYYCLPGNPLDWHDQWFKEPPPQALREDTRSETSLPTGVVAEEAENVTRDTHNGGRAISSRETSVNGPHSLVANRPSLAGWVAYGTTRACSDPRDHVYAMLGCPTATSQPTIRPDYNRSLTEVYVEFARHLLAENEIVSIIYNSCRHPSILPTWLPDLTCQFSLLTAGKDRGSTLAAWQFAAPSLSSDGLALSCCFAYFATIDESPPGLDEMHQIRLYWEADEHSCNAIYYTTPDNAYSVKEPIDGTTLSMISLPPDEARGVCTGDIVCGLVDDIDSCFGLLLRPSKKPASWHIIPDCSILYHIDGDDMPSQRRRYQLV